MTLPSKTAADEIAKQLCCALTATKKGTVLKNE
jgi:hypothetical protein